MNTIYQPKITKIIKDKAQEVKNCQLTEKCQLTKIINLRIVEMEK
jgi:hypothetical protein